MPIPFKEITLGDKTYKLRFGMGAMIEYEELTGNKLTEFGNDTSMSDLCEVLWVMLKQNDESLTLKSASELIDEEFNGTMQDLMALVNEVINMAIATPGNPKKPTAAKKSS
jgi:hypothetical protein